MGSMEIEVKSLRKKNRRDWTNAATRAKSSFRRRHLYGYRWGHRVPPAGLPNEQVVG